MNGDSLLDGRKLLGARLVHHLRFHIEQFKYAVRRGNAFLQNEIQSI